MFRQIDADRKVRLLVKERHLSSEVESKSVWILLQSCLPHLFFLGPSLRFSLPLKLTQFDKSYDILDRQIKLVWLDGKALGISRPDILSCHFENAIRIYTESNFYWLLKSGCRFYIIDVEFCDLVIVLNQHSFTL